MAKRRANGEGNIRKRDDGRWEGRIVVGHKDGGDPIFRYTHDNSQKGLVPKLRRMQDVYAGVELAEDCKLTLGEWLDLWIEEYAPATSRPSTLQGYRMYTRNYVKPYLGKKRITSLRTEDFQKLYGKLRESGRIHEHPEYGHSLSDSTVARIHSMLRLAMQSEKQERLIPVNPTANAVPPKPGSRQMKILNDEQLDKFMAAIKSDPAWYAFFYTEMTTGLRRGEICGLRWDDFDEKEGTLKVRRSIHMEKGGRLVAGETKTGTGKRTIILPESTANLLRERKRGSYSAWIFPNLTFPEKPLSPNSAYYQLKKILKVAGLPDIRFHDCRHTFSSHALASGVDPKTLSGILGHTNASFTLDTYAHVTGEMQKRAAGIVGAFIEDII